MQGPGVKNSAGRGYAGSLLKGEVIGVEVLWIFSFALVLRAVLIIQNPVLYAFDAYAYLLGLFSEYPLFTGFVKVLISQDFSVAAVRLVTAVIASLASAAFYLFVRKLFDDIAFARTAALLMTVWPPFLIFSIVPYTEPFFFLFLFAGLWGFEKEDSASQSSYPGTGICLGLACLVRYEGVILLPLLFAKIIWTRRKALLRPGGIFRLGLVFFFLFWGPVVLFIYKHLFLPEVTAYQSAFIGHFIQDLFPFLKDFFLIALPNTLGRWRHNFFPLIPLCLLGITVMTIAAFIYAVVTDGKRHVLYMAYLVLAGLLQLLPVYQFYAGRPDTAGFAVSFVRVGMTSTVFLLLYMWYGFYRFFKRGRGMFPSRKCGVFVLVPVFLCGMFLFVETGRMKVRQFQEDYRTASVTPHWIGGPQDRVRERRIVAFNTRHHFNVRLAGTGLEVVCFQDAARLSEAALEEIIGRENVHYVLFPDRVPGGESRLGRILVRMGFKRLASFREIVMYIKEGAGGPALHGP